MGVFIDDRCNSSPVPFTIARCTDRASRSAPLPIPPHRRLECTRSAEGLGYYISKGQIIECPVHLETIADSIQWKVATNLCSNDYFQLCICVLTQTEVDRRPYLRHYLNHTIPECWIRRGGAAEQLHCQLASQVTRPHTLGLLFVGLREGLCFYPPYA
ncbi:uncharacterized protein LOC124723827 [Schistocerca piceifrons]|uniref:uncharacterized protein LOC124723827 n=1 Tax=Schistocerca piceifrons TaxID=274613 RepID=UPI001F5EB219|nr:uncharacterized protein LOC124723827 [Schistocerca piceifrons]